MLWGMRWLILGPPGNDTFADNLTSTLSVMGHEARTVPWMDRFPFSSGIGRRFEAMARRARGGVSPDRERRALRIAASWHPEVVLAPTVQVSEEALAGFHRLGVRSRVAWWGDSPANLSGLGLATPGWDLVLFKDLDAVRKYRLLGVNAHHMHEAMNPAWHRVVSEQSSAAIAVVGNWYGFRQSLVSLLMKRGVSVALYGTMPPRWSLPEIRRAHSGRYVVKEEKSRVFGDAMACLNSFSPAEGNSLNCRTFEIAGAAGLQLIESRPAIEDCFEPDKELLAFSTLDQLLSHVDRAQRAPGEMSVIRAAGARRALGEHTYRHRVERVLALLARESA